MSISKATYLPNFSGSIGIAKTNSAQNPTYQELLRLATQHSRKTDLTQLMKTNDYFMVNYAEDSKDEKSFLKRFKQLSNEEIKLKKFPNKRITATTDGVHHEVSAFYTPNIHTKSKKPDNFPNSFNQMKEIVFTLMKNALMEN